MSIHCRLLLLACTAAFALSCADRKLGRGLAAPQAEQHGDSRWTIADSQLAALRPNEHSTHGAYAPTRAPQADTYVWHNHERVDCPPEPSTPKAGAAPLHAVATHNLLAALPERASAPESAPAPSPLTLSPELVVARLRPALHHCFARWLDAQSDAQGSVRLSLALGCAGEVESISAEAKGVNESALACLFSAVAPARFAAPPTGHAALSVPIVFKNLEPTQR